MIRRFLREEHLALTYCELLLGADPGCLPTGCNDLSHVIAYGKTGRQAGRFHSKELRQPVNAVVAG